MGRAFVNQGIQVGKETTPGTAVPGNKLLRSLSFNLSPKQEANAYRAHGFKLTTASQIHRIWSEGPIEGPLDFNEVVYILSTILGTAVITTPATGTNSRQWLFSPKAQGDDASVTLTVEKGDSTAVSQITNVAATDINFNLANNDLTVGGTAIGRAPISGSLTGSPTPVGATQVIGSARQVDVFIADALGSSNATLYASKLTDAIHESFGIAKKQGPRFVHNTTYPSFKDIIEMAPDLTANFTTEHNAQSRALYDSIINNPTKFLGFRVTGPIIETTIAYLFEIIFACNIRGAAEADEDGVYAYSYDATPIYDSTLGTAGFTVRVINTVTAL
jgi:hypothetical protein